MRFLASDDVPHYQLSVFIGIPDQRDKRGVSKSKTATLISVVETLTVLALVKELWGDHALFAKIVTPSIERSRCGARNQITIKMPAPVGFSQADLAATVLSSWQDILGMSFEAYVDCKRHYTVEEVLEHCW